MTKPPPPASILVRNPPGWTGHGLRCSIPSFSMCGRYTDTKRDKQFLVRMGLAQAEIDFVPRYNLAPSQNATILACADNEAPQLRRARWGLIPFWATDEKIGNSLVNARAEGLSTKPAFRTSFRKRRCLVLADGFFEWQKLPGGKQPMYIHLKDQRPFAFAGLWDRWNDLETFSIITVPPNTLLSSIHDRMPLILPEESISRWLDPKTPIEQLNHLLRPYPADQMDCFPVSTVVNTPMIDSQDCIQPVQPGSLLKLQPTSRQKRPLLDNQPMLPGL